MVTSEFVPDRQRLSCGKMGRRGANRARGRAGGQAGGARRQGSHAVQSPEAALQVLQQSGLPVVDWKALLSAAIDASRVPERGRVSRACVRWRHSCLVAERPASLRLAQRDIYNALRPHRVELTSASAAPAERTGAPDARALRASFAQHLAVLSSLLLDSTLPPALRVMAGEVLDTLLRPADLKVRGCP